MRAESGRVGQLHKLQVCAGEIEAVGNSAREFRRREREFPDHARAAAWERENVHLLLSGPRRR